MLSSRVIACLDVDAGRVVKGRQFSELRDAGDPVELACSYQEQGADEICLLDISATVESRATNRALVAALRQNLAIPLLVGGGVKTRDDAAALLASGADKVAINSAALRRPALIEEMARDFGSQCTVVAIDSRRIDEDSWAIMIDGGRGQLSRSAQTWAIEAVELGAGELLLTSWDRDGTGCGYDLDLLSQLSRVLPVSLIASGGASHPEDLLRAYRSGAAAALVASMLHFEDWTIAAIKSWLAGKGVVLRS